MIYLVRAFAILGVIFVHVSSIPIGAIVDKTSFMFLYFNFLNIFNRFGTPTFIFLSAFVLFYNYYDRPMNKKLMLTFFQRRFLYILLPYLFCSIYYYVIQIYYSYGETWQQFAQQASLADFLHMLLWGKAFYHLYFVFISIQFYVLFPILLWIFQRKPSITKHLIWIGFVLQLGFALYNHFSLKYADTGQLAISYIANYFLGAYCGIYYNSIKEWIIITKKALFTSKAFVWIALWIIWITASLGDVYLWYWTRVTDSTTNSLYYQGLTFVHAYTTSLVLMQLSSLLYRKLHPRVTNVLIHLGVASFGIYIVHAGVLFFYFKISAVYKPVIYYLYVGGGYLASLLISWALVGLAHKYFRNSWLLFGSQPKYSPYLETRRPAYFRQNEKSLSN
ncbi:acyltransferase [Paenibacillus eucommiae]|uniref:Peptidoglycan/LPS O-acetylase OafA/YrhL n=1 Tax=Paenibacillus eucommiae TaxID=1355755 RepID=A0ABS4J243_9BACL|nr:acyltransferase [Paenibacillus eucommiae]MBP1993904.1 peptidoglycan/LPS O-acetylase OafA/YrhL [Paenibacillus eucommiae]